MFQTTTRLGLLAACVVLTVPAHTQTRIPRPQKDRQILTGIVETLPPTLRIYGALSNFDCPNDEPDDACGFEIEIEGIQKEDVAGTWGHSAFGAPTVSTIGTPTAPSALVRYYSDTAVVPPGGVTHFGVTLSAFAGPHQIQRRWLIKPTTVMPNPPPAPVVLPTHHSEVISTNGVRVVREGITNDAPDGGTVFWILPYANSVRHEVALDDLMANNSVVQNSIPLGGGQDGMQPERLDPGDTWTNDDAIGTEDNESSVTSYEVFADEVTYPNGVETHAPGHRIAFLMDATLTATGVQAVPQTLTLSDASVYGTQSVTGRISMNGAAPLGGWVIALSSSSASTTLPATVTIPENQSSATFTIATSAVATLTTANITAVSGGGLRLANFNIKPPDLYSVWLAYRSVRGGTDVNSTITLTTPAPAGGLVVTLSSSSTLAQVPATVTVPAGAATVNYVVHTSAVTRTTSITIRATFNSLTKSASMSLIR